MIRGFFRLVGLLLLAGGFIFMVYDGARWVADQSLRFTRFGQFWNDIHQSSQQAFRAWVEGTAPWLWTSVVRVILDQPALAVLGVLGSLLMVVFPPRQPAVGVWAVLGLGSSGGAERNFGDLGRGIFTTAVGYAGGHTKNPTYEEVCSGRTGHTEAVLVVFDPNKISYDQLLKTFWESHNPTQGMRQGNDVGTQYRSAIYTFGDAQRHAADASRAASHKALAAKGLPAITTEIAPAGELYFAEDYHQQYLAKNPAGYCGLRGTRASCPLGAAVAARPLSSLPHLARMRGVAQKTNC